MKDELNIGVFETDEEGTQLIAKFRIGHDANFFVKQLREATPPGHEYHVEIVRYDVEWS